LEIGVKLLERRAREAGIPYAVVAAMMGWSAATAIRMVKRYGHIGNQALRDAADVLGATKNLSTQTGFTVQLPNSGGQQFFSGADVEFDPVHKLFLIAQPNSSSAPSGSTIYVYDIHGNLQETINGFSFSNTFNVVPMHIALHPSVRSGYVDGPDRGVTEIQAFTY
jgi:hypothetical protein